MNSRPFMKLFWDDYLRDTEDELTLEQHGAYLLLLGWMWRRGGAIPDDDALIARKLRVSTVRWRRHLRPALEPLLTIFDGKISQKRLEKELGFLAELSAKNSAKAKARWAKNNDLADAGASSAASPAASPKIPESQIPESKRERISLEERDSPLCVSPLESGEQSNGQDEETPSAGPLFGDEQQPEPRSADRKPKARSRADRRSRVSDDWQPSATTREWAAREHPTVDLDLELEKFKNHHGAKGNLFADVDRAFRNWVLNAEIFNAERHRAPNGAAGKPRLATTHERRAALARAASSVMAKLGEA